MNVLDSVVNRRTSISGLAAISRYRERELVPQFWQHIRPHDRRQLPGFSNRHVQPRSSPDAASVHRRPDVEVVQKDIPQTIKMVNTETLRLEEHRALPSVTCSIIHKPHCKRLRMRQQASDRLRDAFAALSVEQSSQFNQIWMGSSDKPPERVPAVVVTMKRRRLELEEFKAFPLYVCFEAL